MVMVSCSKEPQPQTAIIKGTITVADSVDFSGNYSGIALVIPSQDSVGAAFDTLYWAETDSAGAFQGTATFSSLGVYSMVVSRDGEAVGLFRFILADKDTVTIQAELPDLQASTEIDSRENRALTLFNRINKNYQKIVVYISRGAVPDSLISDELYKWSNLFWDIHKEKEGTYAAHLAVRQALSILRGVDNELMMKRIDEALPDEYVIGLASDYGADYLLESKGLERTVHYLDSLKKISDEDLIDEALDRQIIKLYIDSVQVDIARKKLSKFESKYKKDEWALAWANDVRYDLNYLAPGIEMPPFSFVKLNGDSVSNSSLKGRAYLMEITPLTDPLYQSQYDRSIVIYQLYNRDKEIEFFTIPLDTSPVTVNAFYEERPKNWPVAQPGSFDSEQLLKSLNVNRFPTRILVDKNGKIIRKYVAEEYENIIQGLNEIIKQN